MKVKNILVITALCTDALVNAEATHNNILNQMETHLRDSMRAMNAWIESVHNAAHAQRIAMQGPEENNTGYAVADEKDAVIITAPLPEALSIDDTEVEIHDNGTLTLKATKGDEYFCLRISVRKNRISSALEHARGNQNQRLQQQQSFSHTIAGQPDLTKAHVAFNRASKEIEISIPKNGTRRLAIQLK